jgi:L-lysine exporter family protein LysE/ArgO
MAITAYLQGLGVGASLIVAIGAQNAFVLTQGAQRKHTGLVAALCILCDAALMTLGVAGLGQWFVANPRWLNLLAWFGTAFLAGYGLQATRRVFGTGALHHTCGGAPLSRAKIVTTTLAVTLLNPHVYLDTVVLLGSISAKFEGRAHLAFGAGAVTASTLWFSGLSYGAHQLAPVLNRPRARKVIDSMIALILFWLAGSLAALPLKGVGPAQAKEPPPRLEGCSGQERFNQRLARHSLLARDSVRRLDQREASGTYLGPLA